jgi:hypothetical protein
MRHEALKIGQSPIDDTSSPAEKQTRNNNKGRARVCVKERQSCLQNLRVPSSTNASGTVFIICFMLTAAEPLCSSFALPSLANRHLAHSKDRPPPFVPPPLVPSLSLCFVSFLRGAHQPSCTQTHAHTCAMNALLQTNNNNKKHRKRWQASARMKGQISACSSDDNKQTKPKKKKLSIGGGDGVCAVAHVYICERVHVCDPIHRNT